MENQKQSAVEWLLEQIHSTISTSLSDVCIKELIEISKAMEKHQIIEAYEQGESEWTPFEFKTAQDYYTSSYGK
jgi:hypothetical protein